jgi:hypothetical protein
MPLIIGIELFLGYLLVYSGIHNRGKYALRPWDALKLGAPGQGGRQPASYTGGAGGEQEAAAGPWESWQ